jgi:hypothetical protein
MQRTKSRAFCARRNKRDRGQALVEFLLLLPILLAIVFGIVEFGIAWRTSQVITNVSREGARLAVVSRNFGNKETLVRDRVDSLLVGSSLNLTKRTTTLYCDGVAGALCGGAGQSGGVQIEYEHTFVVLGPVMDLLCVGCGSNYGTITLSAVSTMRTE